MAAALAKDAAGRTVEPRAKGEEVAADLTTPTRATVVMVVGKVVVEGEEVVAGARARGEGAAELTTPTRVTVVEVTGKMVGVAAAAESANRIDPDPRASSTNSARARKN